MAFDEATVAEIVRHRLGEVDASGRARVIWAIPQALDRLARKVAADKFKRSLLMSQRDSSDFALTAGTLALSTVRAAGILIEYLHYGTIWHRTAAGQLATYPLQRLEPDQFPLVQTMADDYQYYWLDGDTLRMKQTTSGPAIDGSLRFACPYKPTLTQLSQIAELHDDFIDKVIEVSTGPGSDTAEDSEK